MHVAPPNPRSGSLLGCFCPCTSIFHQIPPLSPSSPFSPYHTTHRIPFRTSQHPRHRRSRLILASTISPDNADDSITSDDSASKDRGNSHQDATSDEAPPSPQNDAFVETMQTRDPLTLKNSLLDSVARFTDGGTQRQELETLILSLESLKNIPATEVFTETALAGEWNLLFSSVNMRPTGNIRIREIGQIFDIESKTLTNKALWSFTGSDNVQQIRAQLFVTASYVFESPGRLRVELIDHKVKTLPQEDGSTSLMPEDLQDLIRQLRKALPIEFFDPSGLIDVTYIEPHFRLAKVMGGRVDGVRNVFERRGDAKKVLEQN